MHNGDQDNLFQYLAKQPEGKCFAHLGEGFWEDQKNRIYLKQILVWTAQLSGNRPTTSVLEYLVLFIFTAVFTKANIPAFNRIDLIGIYWPFFPYKNMF